MKARCVRIQISPELLPSMFEQNSAWRMYKGLPKGSKLRGFMVDPHNQNLVMFVEHDSFDLVDVSAVFPGMELEFVRIA